MKKILEWLKKFNTPLYYGILCAVFGLAFIILPYTPIKVALDILLVVAGVASIFVGILTVTELEGAERGARYYVGVAKTIGLIAFGIFLIVSRSALAYNICLVFGVYILFRSIPTLVRSVMAPSTASKEWWIKLILSILEILLGLWLIIYPVWPATLAGAMLILLSVDLFAREHKRRRTGDTRSDTIFDPHFEDRS